MNSKFVFPKWIIIILMFICITCVRRYKYEYYANGNIELQAEIKNGVNDGILLEYFENGSLESEQTWARGKLDGKFVDYYPSGLIFREGTYKEGKRQGEWIYYNKDGSIFQIQHYDGLGHIADIKRFLPDGGRDLKPFPYIYFNSPELSDTLRLNSTHTLYIKVVNISDSLLRADELVFTNAMKQNASGRITVADTIDIIRPDLNYLYKYDFVPRREGEDRFVGLIYCRRDDGEFIDVINMGFSFPFFVKNGKGRSNIHQAYSLY